MDKDDKDNKINKNTKKQTEYIRFMFITVTVGVIICIAVFFIVFYTMDKNKTHNVNKPISPTEPTSLSQKTTSTSSDEQEETEILGVILSLNKDSKEIKIYNLENDREISLKMAAGANMQNEYNQLMTLGEFTTGDIVEVMYNSKDMQFNSLKTSSKSWTQKSVTGLKLNISSMTIKSGTKTYKYNSRLISKYDGEYFDITNLDEMDTVTLKGYDNTVWSVELEKGHGLVSIINSDKILDGTIEIDTNIFKPLSESKDMKVSQGEHRIVVKGSNIESYTKQFNVGNNEEVKIDLSEIQIKSGVLIIKPNVNDYILFINDQEQLIGEPIVLEYGSYSVKAMKEEYIDFTTTIIIDKPTITLEISMEKEQKVLMGELKVNTIPIEGVNVYVDNVLVGISPLKMKLEYGEHKISVAKEGYTDIDVYATISEIPSEIRINMIKSSEPSTLAPDEEASINNSTASSEIDVTPIY